MSNDDPLLSQEEGGVPPSRILIVEDESIIALDMREQLIRLGYEVVDVVATGEEAVRAAVELRPDLVFMDIQLRDAMDGVEAATEIRDKTGIPVVFLTANTDAKTVQRATGSGPFGYLIKPYESKDLYSAVEVALYRSQMERRLVESEQRWITTLKSIGDAVISTDGDGLIMFLNPEAERLGGWSQEEATGRPVSTLYRLIGEQSGRSIDNPVQIVLEGGKPLSHDRRALLLCKYGNTIAIDETAAPIRDCRGETVGAAWVLRDVSEARRMENRLVRAKERYRGLLEGMNDGFFVTDEIGTLTFVNQACAEILGFQAPEDLLGRNISNFVHPEYRQQWSQQFAEAVNVAKTPELIEIPVVTSEGGETVSLEVKLSLVRAAGQVLGLQGVFRDITQRKMSEALLKEAEERFNLIAESTADAIVLVDEKRKITFWNAAAEGIFGYEADEVIGNDLLDYVAFDHLRAKNKEKTGARPGLAYFDHGSKISQMQALRKDGTACPVEVSLSSIQLRGKWQTVLICRDVGDRKRAEAELNRYRNQLEDLVEERTEELSRANEQLREEIEHRLQEAEQRRLLEERVRRAEKMESLGILAGGVAHDLNNMLGPLAGYPELILLKLPEDSPAREMLLRVEAAALDAAAMVDDLLTLSRRGRCKLTPTDINDVVEHFCESPSFLKLSSESSEVAMEMQLDPTIPRIMGSAPHLLKVIMNLVFNAYEAVSGKGKITVQTSFARTVNLVSDYDNIAPGEYVLLVVRDSGEGIDAANLKRIFEPYYSTKKMDGSGTGLGLAVVHGVVKDHNAYYDVISEAGSGAEFRIYFPVAPTGGDAHMEVQPTATKADSV